MSGICGILSLNGRTIDPAEIKEIAKSLERRGPDGTHVWREGPVALGHTLLATTPEALTEMLPLTDPQSGCTITADVRLDNREELISTLGMEAETRTIGDGELILHAYLHWGEACPEHLLGDFAFAIWDPRSSVLFGARDHMGMRPLSYYHRPGQIFVFATEPEAIVDHPLVPKQINEGRIADFLDNLEGLDLTSTFFDGIVRLPPAHSLTASMKGVMLRRYWELQLQPELKLESDEAYAKAFLDVFAKAVLCRLRSTGSVASMLSGGMDSGSVVAVASRLLAANDRGPLHTFSAVGPDGDSCIETRTILKAASLTGLAPHFVSHADLSAYHVELMGHSDGAVPFDLDMTLIRTIYLAAHRAGMKVVLDGVGGDLILSPGNCTANWLRKGRIIKAVREARGETHFWGPAWPAWKNLIQAAWVAFVPRPIRTLRRELIWRYQDRRIEAGGVISRDFAGRIDLTERRARLRCHSHYNIRPDEQRVRSILDPHLVAARERYDRVASAAAIEPRDPFLDIRLIEFSLSLPWQQLQAGGWPKIVLRRAMADLLPDAVIWRRGKDHLGWSFTQALFQRWVGWKEQLRDGRAQIGRFVKPIALTAGKRRPGKTLDISEEIKLFYLLRWIQRHGPRPSKS